MRECPFCELGTRVLDENELACCFASDPCLCFGHLLVVPKRHIEQPWELSESEALAV